MIKALFKLLSDNARYVLYGFAVMLSACDVTEEPLNSNYEIRLEPLQVRVGDESTIRQGDKFELAVYNVDTGNKDFSAALSNDSQSFQADEYRWSLSDDSAASFELETGYENVITVLKPSSFTISAINSQNTTSITVDSILPLLQDVSIGSEATDIILGHSETLSLNGTFSDSSQTILTDNITWSVDDELIAQVDALGQLNTLSEGQVVVTAEINNGISNLLTATKTFEITPAGITSLGLSGVSNTPLGREVSISATAVYTDSTSVDLSAVVDWQHNNQSIGTLDAEGKFQTLQIGSTGITASIDDGYGTLITAPELVLEVEDKVVDGLAIKPVNGELKSDPLTIPIDKIELFTIEATYSNQDVADITTDESLTFSTSNPEVAETSFDEESGLFSVETFTVGNIELSVTKTNRNNVEIVGTEILAVNKPLLLSIDIEPVNQTFALGLTTNWKATGHFENNIEEDVSHLVTWTSSNLGIADFNTDNQGELTALTVGSANLTATLANDLGEDIVSSQYQIETTSALLTQVTIVPTDSNLWIADLLSLPLGISTPVQVIGLYTDNTQLEETNVAWTSSDDTQVNFSSDDGFSIATNSTSTASRSLNVTASVNSGLGTIVSQIDVEITQAKLDSLSIELPENKGLWQGYTQPIKAVGVFSDGVEREVSDQVNWSIATEFESNIAFTASTSNTLDLLLQGDVTLSATFVDPNYNSLETTESLNFTIAAPLLERIEIESYYDSNKDGEGDELVSELAKGQSGVFLAIGHYSDGSTQDVTSQVEWETSDSSILTVVASGDESGTAFAANSSDTDVMIGANTTNADGVEINTTIDFPVSIAVLELINLVPAPLSYGANVPSGESVQIDVWGIYSDGTYKQIEDEEAAVWESSNIEVAVVNATTGFVEIVAGDNSVVTISATEVISGNNYSATLLLNRIDTVFTSIRVEPDSSETPWIVSLGSQYQFKAYAVFADESEVEITTDEETNWSIPNTEELDVAIINNSDVKGLVTALTQDDNVVTITVSSSNRFDDFITTSAEIIVGAPILELIEVVPANTQMVAGDVLTFTATGYTSDDRFLELTDTVSWSVNDTSIADFNQTNVSDLYGKIAGDIEVSANYTPPGQEEISTTTQLTVTAPTLRSIEITPTVERVTVSPEPEALFLKGVQDLLVATGIYSNGSSSEINGDVSWTSSDTDVATIDVVGILSPMNEGETVITAEITIEELGESKVITVDYPITVGGPLLKYLELSPLSPTTIINLPLQFTATGFYSDGSDVDLTEEVTWQVGRQGDDVDLLIGTMTSGSDLGGQFIGKLNGFGPVSAAIDDYDGNEISKQTFVTVSPLAEIAITNVRDPIYAGQSDVFTAVGTTDNGKSIDFTTGLEWQVSGAGGALIDSEESTSNAEVSTASAGDLNVSAEWVLDEDNIINGDIDVEVDSPLLTSIAIEISDSEVPNGRTSQLTATGTYSDESTADLTDSVTWNVSDTDLAEASSDGSVSTSELGEVEITATATNVETETLTSNTLSFSIGDAVLDQLHLNYADSELARGTLTTLVPSGTMTDGVANLPTTVTWESSDTSVVTVDNGGVVYVLISAAVGSEATITASAKESFGSTEVVTTSIVITVGEPVLASLAINSTGGSIPRGTSSTLTAAGLLTDDTVGLPTTLTWSSSDSSIMAIDSATGEVTVPDSATISDDVTISVSAATFSGSSTLISNSSILSVGAPLVESLSISNGDISVARGTSVTMVPVSTMSDSSASPSLTWSTSDANVAVISNTGTLEIPNGATLGSTATIMVSAPETTNSSTYITDSILVTVEPPILDALTISATSNSVARGTEATLSIAGTLSDNGAGLPTTVEWSSSDDSVATVSSSGVVAVGNSPAVGSTVIITAQAKTQASSSDYVSGQYVITVDDPIQSSIDIDQADSEVGLGQSISLSVSGSLSDGTNNTPSSVEWSSSNTSTATVDSSGMVTILDGTTVGSQALITVKTETTTGSGVYTSSSVTITAVNAVLESLTLSATSTSVPAGTSQQIDAVGDLSNGTNGILTSQIWSSADTDIATVDSGGLVTVLSSATVGDTVSIEMQALELSGSSTYITDSITITVDDPNLSSIEITTEAPTIPRGTSLTLAASGSLTDNSSGLPTTLTWASTSTSVATVDSDGIVTISSSATVGSQSTITLSAPIATSSSTTVTDSIVVTVGQAELETLTLSATETDVHVGTTQQVDVAAVLSDTSTTMLTTQVWTSSDTGVATVDSGGLVTVLSTATSGDTVDIELNALDLPGSSTYIAGSITITVDDPIMSAIEITTDAPTIPKGSELTLSTQGTQTDGSNGLLTTLTWSSSSTSVATVDSNGVVTIDSAASIGSQSTITVSAPVETGSSTSVTATVVVTAGQAELETLTLSATETDVHVGTTQQVDVAALLSDASTTMLTTQVWTSSDTDVATVDSGGLVTVLSTATSGDTVDIELNALDLPGSSTYITGSITITVDDPIMSAIEITTDAPTIPKGSALTLATQGTQTDGSNGLLTTLTWSSSSTSVATVDSNGIVTIDSAAAIGSQSTITVSAPLETGSSNSVTATIVVTAGQAELDTLTLSATETNVHVGTTQQIDVAAVLSDASTTMLTTQVWTSGDTDIATVDSGGLVTVLSTASSGDTVDIELNALDLPDSSTYITGTITITIDDPIMSSIEITTDAPTIPKGSTLTLGTLGTQTDNSNGLLTTLTWSSSSSSVATVDSNGIVTIDAAASIGSQSTITVTAPVETGSSTNVSTTVIVTAGQAELESLTLSATETDVHVGTTQQVDVAAVLSDASTTLLTTQVWTSGDTDIATVDSGGLVTVLSTATSGDTVDIELNALDLPGSSTYIAGSLTLTIDDPIMSSIEITTDAPTIPKGSTLTLGTLGTQTDNSNGLLTTLTWSSSSTSVATVDSNGIVTMDASASIGSQSTITVTAPVETGSSTNVSATVTVTAGEAELETITLSATETDVPVGTTQQIDVAAVLSDASTTMLTTQVWSSSDTDIATVDSSGLVTFKTSAVVDDTVDIEMKALEITDSSTYVVGTITLSVDDAVMTSIDIDTFTTIVPRGTSLTITATGTLSDTTNGTPTTLTWSSLNTANATIDSSTGEISIPNSATIGNTAVLKVSAPIKTGSSTNVEDTIEVTVGDADLASLSISSSTTDVAIGKTLSLSVAGTLTDGDSGIPTSVLWSSDDEDIATVDGNGLVTVETGTSSPNTVVITAKALESSSSSTFITDTITLSIDEAEVTSVEITTASGDIPRGTSVTLTAQGTLSSTANGLTDDLTWSCEEDPCAVTVDDSTGEVTAADGSTISDQATIKVTTPISSGSGTTVEDTFVVTITNPKLETLTITEGDSTVEISEQLDLNVTGVLSDGSTTILTDIVWSSDNADFTIDTDTGLVTVENTASDDETATITVTAAEETGSATDITATVTITASEPVITSITLTEADQSVPRGTSIDVIATATKSDGSTVTREDLSTDLSWSSADTDDATVVEVDEGTATALATISVPNGATKTNTVVITASVPEKSGSGTNVTTTITITVGEPTLSVALASSTGSTDVALGTTTTITPTFTYSDGDDTSAFDETSLTWSTPTVTPALITLDTDTDHGDVQSIRLDSSSNTTSVDVELTADDSITATINLTVVDPVIESLEIHAYGDVALAEEQEMILTPVAIYSDKTTAVYPNALDWEATDTTDQLLFDGDTDTTTGHTGDVTIVSVALSSDVSAATITVTDDSTTPDTTATTTLSLLDGITETAVQNSVAVASTVQDSTYQLFSYMLLSNHQMLDITEYTGLWSNTAPSDTETTVDTSGLVTFSATAVDGTVTADDSTNTAISTSFTVEDGTLTDVEVYPRNPTIRRGKAVSFKAYGLFTYSAGAESIVIDITDQVTWSSADTDILTDAGAAVATGTDVVLTASLSSIDGTTSVDVVDAISSITLSNVPTEVNDNGATKVSRRYQISANATYASGYVEDITEQVLWSSSDSSKATISNASGEKGLMSPVLPVTDDDTVTFTAEWFTDTGLESVTSSSVTLATNAVDSFDTITISHSTSLDEMGKEIVTLLTAEASYDTADYTVDVTDQVTWTSDTPTAIHVSNAPGIKGQISSVGDSTATVVITASMPDTAVTDTYSITRTNAILTTLTVSPTTQTIADDATQQFTVIGTFATGDSVDLTDQVVWTSDVDEVVISNAEETRGLATRISTGDAVITATLGLISGSSGTID